MGLATAMWIPMVARNNISSEEQKQKRETTFVSHFSLSLANEYCPGSSELSRLRMLINSAQVHTYLNHSQLHTYGTTRDAHPNQ
jgi:hypothetical protein